MLRRIWIIAFLFVNVSQGVLVNIEDYKIAFIQIQVKIEFSITIYREDIYKEANKLDGALVHFQRLIERKAKEIEATVVKKHTEAQELRRSINHCIKGIKFFAKNLDLYNLHQCKKNPWHVDDKLLEAKKLSLSIPKQKTNCILKHGSNENKLRLCFENAIEELNKRQLNLFRVIRSHKEVVLKNGLICIQDNYNILKRELCMLNCQFEKCVDKNCKPRQNEWIFDKPPHELL